jgi:hypothetical protein
MTSGLFIVAVRSPSANTVVIEKSHALLKKKMLPVEPRNENSGFDALEA